MANEYKTINLEEFKDGDVEELDIKLEGEEEEEEEILLEVDKDEPSKDEGESDEEEEDSDEEEEEDSGDEGDSGEEEEEPSKKKKYSRSQRLKYQRDQARKEAREAAARLAETQGKLDNAGQVLVASRYQAAAIVAKTLEDTLTLAKATYRDALDLGDPDKIAESQELVTGLQIKLDNLKASLGNAPKPQQQQKQQQEKAAPKVDEKAVRREAERFVGANGDWWNVDKRKTQMAIAIDAQLNREGFDPSTPEFYDELEERLEDTYQSPAPKKKQPEKEKKQAVGGRERGVKRKPNSIVITREDQAAAAEMGIPIEEYARQKKALEGKNDQGYVEIK